MRARWKHLAFLFVASVALTLVFQQRSCAASNLTLPASAAEWTLAAPQTCAAPTPAERHAWDGVLAAGRLCRANYAGSARHEAYSLRHARRPGRYGVRRHAALAYAAREDGFLQGPLFRSG